MSRKEFDSSNATSNAFLGGKQKEWMSFNPNASIPPSLAPPTKTPPEAQVSLFRAFFSGSILEFSGRPFLGPITHTILC